MIMKPFSLLKYAFSIAIIAILIFIAGPGKIFQRISNADILWLGISIVFLLLTLIPGTLSLQVLLMPIKKIPIKKIIEYYSLTWALGNLLPGRLGSFYIVYLLKKEKVNLGQSTSIFILDKIITLTSVIAISIFGLTFLFGSEGIIASFIVLGMVLVGSAILYSESGRKFIRNYILKKYAQNFSGFYQTTKEYFTKNLIAVIRNYKWTIVKITLDSIVIWSVFNSLGISIPILFVLTIYCATAISTFVPFTLNGLGVRELLSLGLYSRIGVNTETVISTYLIIYVFNIILSGIILATLMKTEHM